MAADSWTSTLGLSCMALAAGAVLGYSLFIDAGGIVISGQVLRKSETISVNEGSWSRRLSVTVRYQPAGEPRAREVSGNVDAETFDRLHTGSPVAVRYLPWGDLRRVPLLKRARFADQSTFWISKDWYRPLWEAAEVLGGIIL